MNIRTMIKIEEDLYENIEVLGRFNVKNMLPWIIGKTREGKIVKGLPVNFCKSTFHK